MNNFADEMLVSALLAEHGKLTRENWNEVESKVVATIVDILNVSNEQAKTIFKNGMLTILSRKQSA